MKIKKLAAGLVLAMGMVTSVLFTNVAMANGGYPDADAVDCSSTYGQYSWCKNGTPGSSRGYDYRNCTDWVAWRLPQLGIGSVPQGWGNATNWDNAASGSYNVDATPEPGDIAVWDGTSSSPWGHVAVVESVNSNGTVNISEYNKQGDGNYGTRSGVTAHHYIDINGVGNGGGSRPQETSTIPWYFTTLEGDAGSVSGHNANTGLQPAALTFNNQAYVFSYDATNGNLRQGRTTASGWQFTTLDGDQGSLSGHNADVGRTPATTVYGNGLQLFYYSATHGNLRHAWSSNGTGWGFENLDGDAGSVGGHNADTGKTPAVAAHSDGTLQVLYYDQTNGNLRHAWTGGGQGWQFETLEGDPGSVSGHNANVGLDPAIVSYDNGLHAFYYDQTNGNLRHARTTPSQGWQFENLDGDSGSVCGLNANVGTNPTVTVHDGFMHIFYYDATNKNLRHAWSSTTQGWSCETLDGDAGSALGNIGDFGAMTTAASIGGSLQMFAYDGQWGGLRHYWADNNGWHVENFDGYGGGPTGRANYPLGHDPVVINHGGVPKVFYYNHTHGNLRHAIAQ